MVARGEQGIRDEGEETVTGTGTGAGTGTRTRTATGKRTGVRGEGENGSGARTRIERRVEERESMGTYEVVIEMGWKMHDGDDANE